RTDRNGHEIAPAGDPGRHPAYRRGRRRAAAMEAAVSAEEPPFAVKICGKLVFRDLALAAGVVPDEDRRGGPNHESGMVHPERDVYVVDLDIGDTHRVAAGDERANAVGEARQALVAGASGANVQLVRDPVRATGPGDRGPVIVRGVPDEAVFGLDVLRNVAAGG